jgi:ribose 5-phosphate isomerase A
VKDGMLIGLGSGSTVAAIVKEMSTLANKKSLNFIATSLQIKLEAEKSALEIIDESCIPEIDIVFDGADQIDSNFNMIKGGGGALLKEKILISSGMKVIIAADSTKYVSNFSRAVPIEVSQYARSTVYKKLQEIGGTPKLRIIKKGYPFITENSNIIYDTLFEQFGDIRIKESQVKSIPGVIEVGLFTRQADVYYKANRDGSFKIIYT